MQKVNFLNFYLPLGVIYGTNMEVTNEFDKVIVWHADEQDASKSHDVHQGLRVQEAYNVLGR